MKFSLISKTLAIVLGLTLITACNPLESARSISNDVNDAISSSEAPTETPADNSDTTEAPDKNDEESSETDTSSEESTPSEESPSESEETDSSNSDDKVDKAAEERQKEIDKALKTGIARSVLDLLEVKPADESVKYNREEFFGSAWTDKNNALWGNNGCDTRNDILKRDLTKYSLRKGSNCIVESGVINEPYLGETMDFVRGIGTSSKIQIDHQVSLKDAWVTGAVNLTQQQRIDLANDPLNLAAVDGSTNQSKGSKDASEWLPANEAVRCQYVSNQIAVKAKYDLWVTKAEAKAMNEVLDTCPNYLIAEEPGGYSLN